MSLSRHEIREKAFQTLFALNANPDMDTESTIFQVLEYGVQEEEETIEIPLYLDMLVSGVLLHQEELDQEITKHLNNWSLKRIAKTDLVIMRLALFEMKYVEDVPAKVALNEALELAKNFSDDKSRRFINGVLSQFVTELSSKKEAE